MNNETAQGEEVFVTSSTKLATALLSLGETLQKPPCTRQLRREGHTIVTFLFNPGGCGKTAAQWARLEADDPGSSTPDALNARLHWLREIGAENDPVKTAYANAAWRELTLMIVKATPRMVAIHGKDTMGFIREDATAADIRNIQSQL
jgi:hypothetical protein